MEKELGLIGSYADVERMEGLRVKFKARKSAEIFATLIPVECSRLVRFKSIDTGEKATALAATRILLAATREEIRGSINFDDARLWAQLTNARLRRVFTIERMTIAKDLTEDPNGNEYLYGLELCRDLAATCFLYARVFADRQFIDLGIETLKIAGQCEGGASAQARYEMLLQERLLDKTAPSKQLKDAFNAAQAAASDSPERRITNAARLAGTWQSDIRGLGLEALKLEGNESARLKFRIAVRELIVKPLGDQVFRRRMADSRPKDFAATGFMLEDQVAVVRRVYG